MSGCGQTSIKESEKAKYKTIELVVISDQKYPKAQMYPANQAGGAVGAAISDWADETDLKRGAKKLNDAFEGRNLNEDIADGIVGQLNVLRQPLIKKHTIFINKDEFNLGLSLSQLQADLLVVVDVSYSLMPYLNAFEMQSSISLYSKPSKSRIYHMDAYSQSEVFGAPYKLGLNAKPEKTEEERKAEILSINKRFDQQVEEDPSHAGELRKQQKHELKIAQMVKDSSTRLVKSSPVDNLVENNYALFKSVFSGEITSLGILSRAALEDALGENVSDRKNQAVSISASLNNDANDGKLDGYVLASYSTGDRIIFRETPSLMSLPINRTNTNNAIISFPKHNGKVMRRGNRLVDLKDES